MKHCRQRGFVLVMTLFLVALAGLLLSGIARHSIRAATESLEIQDELQMRWGALSCEKALLSNADEYFQQVELSGALPDETPSPYQLALALSLGKVDFELRLADEDTKVNLNTAYSLYGRDRVKELISEATTSDLARIYLRPNRTVHEDQEGDVPAFSSWGQIFDLDDIRANRRGPPAGTGIAEVATKTSCWGDGLLNLRRAPDDAIAAVCSRALGPRDANRLLELRRGQPEMEFSELLQGLALRESQRERLDGLVKGDSSCYSLWIKMSNGYRDRYRFVTTTVNADSSPGDSDQRQNDSASSTVDDDGATISFSW